MAPGPADGGHGDLDAGLRDLTDHQRAREAADERRRAHWLHQQSADEGTFAGVLLDLGEREVALAVSTVGGRTLRGVVRTVGADFVGLRAPGGEGGLVPLGAIVAVRPEPGTAASVGDRVVEVDAALASVLATLAGERPWVSLHTRSGQGFAGELRSVGRDLLTVHGTTGPTYVPLATVSDVALP